MKVLITGATGYFGRELIRQLSLSNDFELIAASSDAYQAQTKLININKNIKIISNDILLNSNDGVLDKSCIIVHAAFCRQSIGKGLAQSLTFSRELYQKAIEYKVLGIINMSSQSLYGGGQAEKRDESTQPSPGYLYAMAKCGSEELLNQAVYFSEGETAGCNIRMASLMGPTDVVPNNVLYKFACSALKSETISIVGGAQKFSFLDVRDAVQAVVQLLKRTPQNWKPIYNLGPISQTGIIEMAELIRDEAEKYTGEKVSIEVHPDENHEVNAGMDSTLLYKDLQWKPEHTFADIVKDTVQFVARQDKQLE